MLSYQDWLKADDKQKFILKAIEEYKSSHKYQRAKTAQKYYAGENEAIENRMSFLQRRSGSLNNSGVPLIFHKLRNGFFPKFCKQSSQYLLGNGVTMDEQYKKQLGARFDKAIQTMGIFALVDGVCWGFWNVDKLIYFRATEFFVLFDERAGAPMIGIKFWKLADDKPLNVTLFEIDGVSELQVQHEELKILPGTSKVPYKREIWRGGLLTEVVGASAYDKLPIFPMYANELKQSEFSDSLKAMIDLYDFISSDLGDSISQTEGIYWAIKNYGGNDARELVEEMERWRATVNDGDAEAKNFVIEAPYEAKQYALKLLNDNMYQDKMALNLEVIQGGSLTNVAINVAKTDFDLKTDLFEWQVADFVQNILSLLGLPEVEIKFKRRSITNDTEMVNNISTMLADGYIDTETALNENPLIADSDKPTILERLLTQNTVIPPLDTNVTEGVV